MVSNKSYIYSKEYEDELIKIINSCNTIQFLRDKVIVITGARGLIGSQLIDTIMFANEKLSINCKVYGIVRNAIEAQKRFSKYIESEHFQLISSDINVDKLDIDENIDFLIHGASNTHPVFYSTRPIETIMTNTIGTSRMLDFATSHNCKRFLFLSSVEIYGENRGDTEKFTEEYLGYINSNTLRAGYPESKRLGEALCQAYIKEREIDCVIPRIARAYGPGLLNNDTKALSQFLHKACNKEDIVLKSSGTQRFSYVYSADVTSALLFLLIKGEKGEAYNIVGSDSDISLKELASYIAEYANVNVIYDIPHIHESEGFSKATLALLDSTKLTNLNWQASYTIFDGIKQTLNYWSIPVIQK